MDLFVRINTSVEPLPPNLYMNIPLGHNDDDDDYDDDDDDDDLYNDNAS